jgi:hypothetical protein
MGGNGTTQVCLTTYLAMTNDIFQPELGRSPLPQDPRIWISGGEKTNSLAPRSPKVGASVGARPRVPPLTSARTAKYIEALIREGNDFDFGRWLKEVREQEAQVKQAPIAVNPCDVVAPRDNPINTPGGQDVRPSFGPALISKAALNPRGLRRLHHQATSQTRKTRLRRWLEKVHRAWDDFQASRTRDAVYWYLEAVFAIVMHFKVRRRTKRLLRHAFEFANLPFDKNTEPFSGIIRCTCGNAADSKTISKWSRALRFAATAKKSRTSLKRFIKKLGGINACVAKYAKAGDNTPSQFGNLIR